MVSSDEKHWHGVGKSSLMEASSTSSEGAVTQQVKLLFGILHPCHSTHCSTSCSVSSPDSCSHTWVVSGWWPKGLGPCHACGRLRWKSQLLISGWSSNSCYSHLWYKPVKKQSLFLSALCLLNKWISLKENTWHLIWFCHLLVSHSRVSQLDLWTLVIGLTLAFPFSYKWRFGMCGLG